MSFPKAARILLAEDQPDIRELIELNLRQAGYEVDAVPDGSAALAAAQLNNTDLLILDLMMPGMGGLDVCKALRAQNDARPILMLTARGSELDRVLGLELGADDYLTKPFSLAELMARVKALLRRSEMFSAAQSAWAAPGAGSSHAGAASHPSASGARGAPALAVVRHGQFEIVPAKHTASFQGARLELTALEFGLLLHFAQHPGHVFSRAQLLDAVWGYSHDGYEHTVTTHINRLRAKVERDPLKPEFIQTVRGAGYKMAEA